MDKNTLNKITQSSILNILERMKHLDADDRYSLFVEYCEMLFNDVDTEEVLIAPTKWSDKRL